MPDARCLYDFVTPGAMPMLCRITRKWAVCQGARCRDAYRFGQSGRITLSVEEFGDSSRRSVRTTPSRKIATKSTRVEVGLSKQSVVWGRPRVRQGAWMGLKDAKRDQPSLH